MMDTIKFHLIWLFYCVFGLFLEFYMESVERKMDNCD